MLLCTCQNDYLFLKAFKHQHDPQAPLSATPPTADKTVRLQPGLPASGLAPPGLGKSLHPALCQHMPVEPEGIRPG